MHKYKLKEGHTPQDTFVAGYAFNEAGVIETEDVLESPLLIEVTEQAAPAPAPAAQPVQQPAPVQQNQTNQGQ